MSHSSLSPAESERLEILAEECAEVIHVVTKILRHGFESRHPDDMQGPTNRNLLEVELGDLQAAIDLLVYVGSDINDRELPRARRRKLERFKRTVGNFLHHQNQDLLQKMI